MARTHDRLDDTLPSGSPPARVLRRLRPDRHRRAREPLAQGLRRFRVLDDRTVAYLDLTGSGVETIAHLNDNGRLTFMFCGFEGPPRIVRLFGRGEVVRPGDDDFDELWAGSPTWPGCGRSSAATLDRIQSRAATRCRSWTRRARDPASSGPSARAPTGIEEYHAEKNRRSASTGSRPGLTVDRSAGQQAPSARSWCSCSLPAWAGSVVAMKSSSTSTKRSGASDWGKWPTPGKISSRLPGMASWAV